MSSQVFFWSATKLNASQLYPIFLLKSDKCIKVHSVGWFICILKMVGDFTYDALNKEKKEDSNI